MTSEDNCQHQKEMVKEEEKEEVEMVAEEHTVTVQGGVNLNCSVPPGPVLVQWEAVRDDGTRLYMTSWLAGFDQEYSRGCGDQYGIDTRGLGHLGCKVRRSHCERCERQHVFRQTKSPCPRPEVCPWARGQ